MLGPPLKARLEERHHLARDTIESSYFVGLVPVADRAAKPKIAFIVCATLGYRVLVFDFQWGINKILVSQAEATAISSCQTDSGDDVRQDAGARHAITWAEETSSRAVSQRAAPLTFGGVHPDRSSATSGAELAQYPSESLPVASAATQKTLHTAKVASDLRITQAQRNLGASRRVHKDRHQFARTARQLRRRPVRVQRCQRNQ
jgi:hypothetical protein